jgi:two-component system, sensor histidine kinase
MTPHDEPVLDARVLEALAASVEGDHAFVVELVEAYLADGASHLEGIRAAVAAGEAETLVRPAHTLKSSSATVGAAALAATARALEMLARTGTLGEEVGPLAQQADAEWAATETALRDWIGGGAA